MATPSFISVASIGRTMNLEPSEPFKNATHALPPTLTYNKKQGGETASLPYLKNYAVAFFLFLPVKVWMPSITRMMARTMSSTPRMICA